MKLRPFELALVITFVVLFIAALFILANYEPPPPPGEVSIKQPITIWGTVDPAGIEEVLKIAIDNDESFRLVTYWYINPDDFDWRLINALADGVGPDLVLVSHEKLVSLRKRIAPISYESFPLPDVRATYLDGAEIFALNDGMYAMPIAVDPLMMYWNRDILSTEGYIQPPATWEQLVNTQFPDLIERDFDRTIRRSVVAMGEYNNVRNAFGAISMLLIQGGSVLVTEGRRGYQIDLEEQIGGSGNPMLTTADFYTRFSRPSNSLYSWNRSLGEDRSEFISEDLALYFGYGSEGHELARLNPNLNFAIAEVPQGGTATVRRTYGKFYGLSILNSSDNFAEAQRVLYTLGGVDFANRISLAADMVPLHRTNVALGSNDIFTRTAYLTAPIARGWLSPNLNDANAAFSTMVSDINENRRTVDQAVGDAAGRLKLAY